MYRFFRGYSDIDNDENNELLNSSDCRFFEWNDKFVKEENYTYIRMGQPVYGDMDADGDMDICSTHPPKAISFFKNNGEGIFGYAYGFKNGLPERKNVNYPAYNMNSYGLGDLNNDGWLDLCTSMGNSGGRDNPGGKFFWLSNGKGDWTEFSKGCPLRDYGVGSPHGTFSVSDMNNDGDLDVVMELNGKATVIFDNNYPEKWEVIELWDLLDLHGNTPRSNFQVADLNNDGYPEICQNLMDKSGKHFMAILWNKGNYSFDIEFSNKLDNDAIEIFGIEDMNSDGTLDIIVGADLYDGNEIVEVNTTVIVNHYTEKNREIERIA